MRAARPGRSFGPFNERDASATAVGRLPRSY